MGRWVTANILDISVVVAAICAIALEILVAFVFMGFPGNNNERARRRMGNRSVEDTHMCVWVWVCWCINKASSGNT